MVICSEFGIIINANSKSYWARNSGNPTLEEGYGTYVYEQVWKHTYKVTDVCNLFFNDEIYNHIHKDQITQQIISEFRFNNAFMDEDEESEDD